MDINQVLSNLFRDKRIDDCVKRFSRPDEAEDLKQDVFIALLSKPHSLITDLEERGMLFFYTTSIIKFTANQNKKKLTPVAISDVADEVTEHLDYMKAFESLPGDFYYKELVKIVAKHGSQLSAAKATGIPVSSVRRDMLFVKNFIKRKVC